MRRAAAEHETHTNPFAWRVFDRQSDRAGHSFFCLSAKHTVEVESGGGDACIAGEKVEPEVITPPA